MFARHVVPRRSRRERFRPLLALTAALCAAATSGIRPSVAEGDAPSGVLTAPVSGPITTFPVLQGTASDPNGDLALVKVLIARGTVTPGTTDRIDFWNGTGWVFAVNIPDGTVPSLDQLKSILTQHVTELPSVQVSGRSASWGYTTVPAGANLTNGKYFVAAGVLDQAFHVGLIVPRSGGFFVTLVKGSTEPVDTTPPNGTLLPATGTYAAFPLVQGQAYDGGGLDHVLIGLLRKVVGPSSTAYQYWNGSAFVTAKTLPNGTVLTPVQIGAIVTSVLSSLPRVPLTGTGLPTPVAWHYNTLPHDAGVYYLAAALFDKKGNLRPLPGAPNYYNTITVGSTATGVTLSGRVTRLDGTETVGVGNVPVLLIPGDSLGAAFLSLTNGAVRRTLTSNTVVGDRPVGSFSFSGVVAGGYVLLPAVQKALPAVQGVYFAPRFRTLTAGTANLANQNFSVAGNDSLNPVVTIEHPAAGSTASSIGACDGSVRDGGGSGLFRIGMVLYQTGGNGAISAVFNWRTGAFVPANTADGSVVKLFGATANADGSGHWSQTLPNLPTGHYRVSVIAADNAFNFSERANRDFSIVK